MRKLLVIAGLVLYLVGCGGDDTAVPVDSGSDGLSDVISEPQPEAAKPPTILDAGIESGSFDLGQPALAPINYYGGPVMTAPINVYFIWYGHWTDTKVAPYLEDMIAHISSTAWWQINTAYYQSPTKMIAEAGSPYWAPTRKVQLGKHHPALDAGAHDSGVEAGITDAGVADVVEAGPPPQPRGFVTNRVNFIESVYVSYTHGTTLTDDDINTIVGETVGSGQLPPDPDGIYFVLTSADVHEGGIWAGFCSDYCAWHTNATILNSNFRIGFVGDTGACEWCNLKDEYNDAGIAVSPNEDWSVDSMATAILHELVESATDPDPSTNVGWQDEYGYENADKCAWTFGLPYPTDNHSIANMVIGTRNYMIQQNFVLDDGGNGHCGMTP